MDESKKCSVCGALMGHHAARDIQECFLKKAEQKKTEQKMEVRRTTSLVVPFPGWCIETTDNVVAPGCEKLFVLQCPQTVGKVRRVDVYSGTGDVVFKHIFSQGLTPERDVTADTDLERFPAFDIAQRVFVVVRNRGTRETWVRASLTCDVVGNAEDSHPTILGMSPCTLDIKEEIALPPHADLTLFSVFPEVARPVRLIVKRHNSRGDVLVQDIKIGQNGQIWSSDPLPIEALEKMSAQNFRFDTVQRAQSMVIRLKNESDESRYISMEMEVLALGEDYRKAEESRLDGLLQGKQKT